MSTKALLLLSGLLALGACSSWLAPATDCVYDKTASAAPGNQICTPSSTVNTTVYGGFEGYISE